MMLIDGNMQNRYNSMDADGRAILILRRSLRILNEILKEFSGIKMLYGIKIMGQVSPH